MSIAHIELVTKRAAGRAGVMAADSKLAAGKAETKTLSAASQATAMAAADGDTWVISVNADTMIAFAAAPVAVAGGGDGMRFLPSGTTREFNATDAGEKCAVILQA
jgi:hypothetical protein